MAFGDFKDLTRRTAVDKVLRDKAFNIAKDSKYDGYQCGLASVIYKLFDKKTCKYMQIYLLVAVLKMRIFQTKS